MSQREKSSERLISIQVPGNYSLHVSGCRVDAGEITLMKRGKLMLKVRQRQALYVMEAGPFWNEPDAPVELGSTDTPLTTSFKEIENDVAN